MKRERREKPRPEPIAFPDDSNHEKKLYGTFTGPALGSPTGGISGVRPTSEMGMWEYLGSPHSPLIKIRDHCHQQWVAVLLTILLLGVMIYFVFATPEISPAAGCITAFGTFLGDNSGVAAYSNCKHSYDGDGQFHYVTVGLSRVETGPKWNYMEYVRRALITTRLLTFPTFITDSETLFNLTALTSVRSGTRNVLRPVRRFKNLPLNVMRSFLFDVPMDTNYTSTKSKKGSSWRSRKDEKKKVATPVSMALNEEAARAEDGVKVNPNNVPVREFILNRHVALPQVGDVVVYARHPQFLPRGHAAMIVGVRGPFASPAEAGGTVLSMPAPGAELPLSPEVFLPVLRGRGITNNGNNSSDVGFMNGGRYPAASGSGSGVSDTTSRENDKRGAGTTMAASRRRRCLYYKVYIAEQNWDNRPWLKTHALLDDADAYMPAHRKNDEKEMAKQGEGKKNVFDYDENSDEGDVSNSDEGVSDTRTRGVVSGTVPSAVTAKPIAPASRRGFSRVLLLRELFPSRAFFLQDTHNNEILGWLRG